MATARPPAPPTPPADIDTNREARDKYWDSMEQYYRDQGLKGGEADSRAKADVERLRKNARFEKQAEAIDPAERARISRLFQSTMGRKATAENIVGLANKSDAEIKTELLRSYEYQQRRGAITVLADEGGGDEDRQTIVFNNNAAGRALLQDKEWNSNRWGPGDEIYVPPNLKKEDMQGLSSKAWAQIKQDKNAKPLDAETIKATPWLKKAGYKPGDVVSGFSRQAQSGFNLVKSIDKALGSNVEQFLDKHVSDQALAIAPFVIPGAQFMLLPGAGNLVYDSYDARLTKGISKITSIKEKDVAVGRAAIDLGLDVALAIIPGAQPALVAKKALQSAGQVASGQMRGKDFWINTAQNVAMAYVGGQIAKAGQSLQAGAAITRGGQVAAQTTLSYGFNKARGMSDSQAAEEAAWSAAGSSTAGVATAARLATSKTEQRKLRNPVTGELDPLRLTQAVANIGLQAASSIQKTKQTGRTLTQQIASDFSPTSLNPIAGVARLAEAGNAMYGQLSGVSYGRLEATPTYAPSVEAAGAEYGGSVFAAEQPIERQMSGSTPMLTSASFTQSPTRGTLSETAAPGSTIAAGRQNYGQSVLYQVNAGTPSEYTMRGTQNYLPSLSGLRNFAATVGNVALFGEMSPMSRARGSGQSTPIGFRQGPSAAGRWTRELERGGWRPSL